MRYDGRRAIVTGGASGIGAATVKRLASEGASILILDIDREGAESVAGEVDGMCEPMDLAEVDSIAAIVVRAIDRLGGLDVLINCAGWDRAMPFVESNAAFWRRSIAINFLGPMAVTHAAIGALSDAGAIVNVASDAGRVGSSGEVVYSGAKAGLIGFSKGLARELASRRIRVNVVAPGPTDTPFLHSFDETGKLAEAMQRQTPLRKLATPDDVAAAITFLASDEAGHITGQVLSVSGGLTMV